MPELQVDIYLYPPVARKARWQWKAYIRIDNREQLVQGSCRSRKCAMHKVRKWARGHGAPRRMKLRDVTPKTAGVSYIHLAHP